MQTAKNMNIKEANRIIFSPVLYGSILEHCKRKLAGEYLEGESQERKAFGLVGGKQEKGTIIIKSCFPLIKNVRCLAPYSEHMNSILAEYAVPSETPLEKRGWVADPEELAERTDQLRKDSLFIVGTYHMHRVAWPDDPLRDRPTSLDTVLAAGSQMLIFIISMVDVEHPVMRAFFEGQPDREVEIIIQD
jgi:hypothetical protein